MSSNVIKARTIGIGTSGPLVIKRPTIRAFQQADEILAEARREADRIVAEGRQKADEVLAAAHKEGYESGVAHWHDTLTAAWRARDEYLAANEAALLQLAVKVAGKIIGEELRTNPETVADLTREALRAARRAKTVVVHANPADASLLQEQMAVLRSTLAPGTELGIMTNAKIQRGDCVIESDTGKIDARIETQLKNMERTLTARANG